MAIYKRLFITCLATLKFKLHGQSSIEDWYSPPAAEFFFVIERMESNHAMKINNLKMNILLSLQLNQLGPDFHDYPLPPKEI